MGSKKKKKGVEGELGSGSVEEEGRNAGAEVSAGARVKRDHALTASSCISDGLGSPTLLSV